MGIIDVIACNIFTADHLLYESVCAFIRPSWRALLWCLLPIVFLVPSQPLSLPTPLDFIIFEQNEQMLEQIWWWRFFFLFWSKSRTTKNFHSFCVYKWRCKTSKCLLINVSAFNWICWMAVASMEKMHRHKRTKFYYGAQILFENVKHSTLLLSTDKYQIHFMVNVRSEEMSIPSQSECLPRSRFKMLPLSISLKIFIVIYFCH